jgi:prolipoprotein diacylglyceryl transferase
VTFASIPSPGSPFIFQVGSFGLRWYGTLLALGVLLAGWMTKRELLRRGLDGEKVYGIAVWCVPAGVIGARLYHIASDPELFRGHWERAPEIWKGGLGLPGVVIGGALGAYIGARRQGLPALVVFDCIAPGLIAAQALGRWGNYFNQELFGGPTSLPWGLEIDPQHRPPRYEAYTTFHPTFLYESLWNGLVCLGLLLLARRYWPRLAAGTLFACYLVAYSFGREFMEALRVDEANRIGPWRVNQWLFGIVFAGGLIWLIALLRRRDPAGTVPPESASDSVGTVPAESRPPVVDGEPGV